MNTLSIIIPTYNYGHLIEQAIQSIISQLDQIPNVNLDVIIVDDCSTDNTLKIVQQYTEYSFITLLRNEENLGPAKSRNKAIGQAQGDYILFLDADDILTNNSIKAINNFILSNNSPDIIIADHHNCIRAENSSISIAKTFKNWRLTDSKQQRFIDYLFNKSISLTAGSVIFKKTVLEKFKFCESLKLNEDLPLFAHALVTFDCKYLPFATVNIIKHDQSLRNNHQLLSEAANALEISEIIFDNKHIPAELLSLKKKYLSLRYLSLFRSYYLAAQYQKARKFYHQAISLKRSHVFKLNYLGKYMKCMFRCS